MHVRNKVRTCPKNCWMVGTAAPVMKKYIKHPLKWVIKNKIKSLLGKKTCTDTVPVCSVGQDPLQGDLREGEGFKNPKLNKNIQNVMPKEERLKLIEEIAIENP